MIRSLVQITWFDSPVELKRAESISLPTPGVLRAGCADTGSLINDLEDGLKSQNKISKEKRDLSDHPI